MEPQKDLLRKLLDSLIMSAVCTGVKDKDNYEEKEEQVHMSLLLFTENTANMMLLIFLFAALIQKDG